MQLAENNEKEMGARNRRRKDGELKREKEKRKWTKKGHDECREEEMRVICQ